MISFRKPGVQAPLAVVHRSSPAANGELVLKISDFNCVLHGSPHCHVPMSGENHLEFLKNNPWPVGTFLTFTANTGIMKGTSPGLQVVLKVQKVLGDMRYGQFCNNINEPRPYLLSSIPIYPGAAPVDPWVRWDDGKGFRGLREDELLWAQSNDLVQAKLKAIQEAFQAGRILG